MKKTLLTILIILITIVALFKIFDVETLILKRLYPTTYSEYVEKYSEKYEIEKEWVYALIKAESDFDKTSLSQSGAKRTYATYGQYCKRGCKRSSE